MIAGAMIWWSRRRFWCFQFLKVFKTLEQWLQWWVIRHHLLLRCRQRLLIVSLAIIDSELPTKVRPSHYCSFDDAWGSGGDHSHSGRFLRWNCFIWRVSCLRKPLSNKMMCGSTWWLNFLVLNTRGDGDTAECEEMELWKNIYEGTRSAWRFSMSNNSYYYKCPSLFHYVYSISFDKGFGVLGNFLKFWYQVLFGEY